MRHQDGAGATRLQAWTSVAGLCLCVKLTFKLSIAGAVGAVLVKDLKRSHRVAHDDVQQAFSAAASVCQPG